MVKIKEYLKMYWPLLVWLISFLLDQQFEILEHSGIDPFWCNIIRAIGAAVLGWMTDKKLIYKSKPSTNEPNPPIRN